MQLLKAQKRSNSDVIKLRQFGCLYCFGFPHLKVLQDALQASAEGREEELESMSFFANLVKASIFTLLPTGMHCMKKAGSPHC